MRRRFEALVVEAAIPVTVLVLWAAWSSRGRSFYFPPLSEIGDAFARNWVFERVGTDLLPSLARMFLGLGIAVVLGFVGGLVLGLMPGARTATAPMLDFLRSLPPPVLVPFAILVLGVGASMKVFVIALGPIWPVLLNTSDGVRSVDPALLDMAKVYGISPTERLRSVVVPAALPQVFAGLRASLSIALILMVISEMVASTNGLGYFVLQSQRTFAIPEMWSGILVLGLIGYSLSAVLVLVERRVLRWHRGGRASALGPPVDARRRPGVGPGNEGA